MKILALEFSSPQRSVAVAEAAETGTALGVSEVIETGAFATKAMGMVESALTEARLEREQVERLVVGLGPGSYTGVRAAIAVAQGWQLATGVRLLGLRSADCVASQAHAEGLIGTVAVVIDAQRNEFYVANYSLTAAGWRETQPLRLASVAEVQKCQKEGQMLIGPEVTRWFPKGRILLPRAASLARLGAGRLGSVSGEALEPIYLRQTTFVKAVQPRRLTG
jgi:tRNA threonylcarbamoyladenosine biosynthesis protein TsaB